MQTIHAALGILWALTTLTTADDPPKSPAATRVMEFKVVDPFNGEAVPDLPLDVQADGKRSGAKTDANGAALLYFPEGVSRLTIRLKKDGFVPTEVSWIGEKEGKTETPATYTLEFEHGTTIGGLIHDEQGKPVKGATVYVLVPNDSNRGKGKPGPTIWDFTCTSDVEGRWHCDVVPSKLDDVWIRLTHPEFASDTMYGKTPKPPMEKLRDLSGVMVLKKGLTVAGKVVDAEGKPIVRARVAQGSDRWGSHYPDTLTDEAGKFAFANAAPGEMVLTVQAHGYAPDLKHVQVGPKMAPVAFKLGSPKTIRIKLVDVQGNPVAGAFVAADTWRECRSIDFRADTNADGRFVWDSAPDDVVQFDMGKEKFMSVRKKPIKADDGEVVVTLPAPLKISGAVVDDKTGEAVPSFATVVGIGWSGQNKTYWRRDETRSHEGGRYEREFDEPNDGHYLEFSAEGYAPHVSRKFMDKEGTVAYDVRLKRGTTLEGVVLGPDGKPLAGATALILAPNSMVFVQEGKLSNDRDALKAETDSEGKFRFPQQAGEFAIAVIADVGIGLIRSADFIKKKQVKVEPWARVEGAIKVGSKPGRSEKLHLDHYQQLGGGLAGPNFSDTAVADEEGRFVFDRVPPGLANVARIIQLSEMSQSYSHRVHVEVKPGETGRVVIGGTGRPVVGRVVAPEGAKPDSSFGMNALNAARPKFDIPDSLPQEERTRRYVEWAKTPEGIEYQKRSDIHYVVKVEPDGSFRVEDVPAGAYELRLFFYGVNRRDLTFTANQPVTVKPIPGGQSDEPFDVGDVKLKAAEKPKP